MKKIPKISAPFMRNTIIFIAAAAALSACTSLRSPQGAVATTSSQDLIATIKGSFAERGPAKLDRLNQTELQKLCTQVSETGKDLDKPTRERLEKAAMASIKYPADGKYIGDWKVGETIAQNGRGLQFSDRVGAPSGANCYACHQISPKEVSFGNQGPSLLKYGNLRGVKDVSSKDSAEIIKYTWGRIYNTHAFNACSNMPRFGDAGILTVDQMKHVMALLLDPASPVNK